MKHNLTPVIITLIICMSAVAIIFILTTDRDSASVVTEEPNTAAPVDTASLPTVPDDTSLPDAPTEPELESSEDDGASPVACTMDAKECPDGTFVGRVAPNCEFAACPTPSEEGEEIAPPEKPEPPVACTMDAKECPDGSYVGRVAPDCEFAACPTPEPDPNPSPTPNNLQLQAN